MWKEMKKASKTVYVNLGVLLVIVVVLAALNRGDPELRRALEENREFLIRIEGEHAATVGLQDLLDLGPEEFLASIATSASAPSDVSFRGVELRVLLEKLRIETSSAGYILVSGLDAYYSPLAIAEVEKEETVYVCFSMDGEILKSQSEGGFGPFLLVIRGERYAQRWCKYVEAVDIKSVA